MCPYCGAWLMNADISRSKRQAERGVHMSQCSKCERLVPYRPGDAKPPVPTEPKQLTLVFED